MACMFNGCSALTSLDVSHFDTSDVTNMASMFNGCYGLTSLDVSHFDTSNVTNMANMFNDCRALTSLDVSHFDTSNVTDMDSMFFYCSGLTSLDVSNFDTSNVTYMAYIFFFCSGLTTLDVSNFDTSNITYMGGMFSGCSALTSLDFSHFDMSNVTVMASMLQNCSSLRYIDFYDSDDTDAITSVNRSSGMFSGLPRTTVIYLPHGSTYVTDAENVVYTDAEDGKLKCPVYYSADKTDIELPYDFYTNEAQYSCAMSRTSYGSAILPYAFTSNDEAQAYTLDEEHETTMLFHSTRSVPAHTPFVFKRLGSKEPVNLNATDASGNFGIKVNATRDTSTGDGPYSTATNLTGWTAEGYYVSQRETDYSDAFYVLSDKFYKAYGALTMEPHRVIFRGEWTIAPSADGAKELEFIDNPSDGEATAIVDATADTTPAATYDVTGRLLRRVQASCGLNIVRMTDGSVKKICVK